jgi:hypothetical protein
MCGSSNLNELLSATALDDLKNETYLEIPRSGVTLQSTIDRDIVQVFEDRVKRSFDWVNCDEPIEFRVRLLEANSTNRRLRDNAYGLSPDDLREIFRPSLRSSVT